MQSNFNPRQSQLYPTQQQGNIGQTFYDDVNLQIQNLEEKLAQEKDILEQKVKNIEKNRSQMSKMFKKFLGRNPKIEPIDVRSLIE